MQPLKSESPMKVQVVLSGAFPSKDGKIIVEKKKRDKVHCKLCNTVIKYSGSTTNLRFHLKEHHRSVGHIISEKKVVFASREREQTSVFSRKHPVTLIFNLYL